MIKRIDIAQLKDVLSTNFKGYYWLSNADAPEEFSDPGQLLSELEQSVPFVIEANLYSEKDQKSISIKNVDGEAIITQIDLKQINGDAYHVQDLAFKSIKGFRDIKVRQVWRSAPDELVEGMDVMRPLITVFTGFKNA